MGQSVIVENRPGANTVIGAEIVARAPADGHTLLLMAQSFTVNSIVRSKLPYDTFKDFTGVTRLRVESTRYLRPSVAAGALGQGTGDHRALRVQGELTFATASILGGGSASPWNYSRRPPGLRRRHRRAV